MTTKLDKPVSRMVQIIADHRDTARVRDHYTVTMSLGGIEFRPKGCGDSKTVFVAWSTVLNLATLASGGRKR